MDRKTAAKPSDTLDPAAAHRRLNTRQVMELVGVKSKNTLWKRVREGKLPRPKYLVPRQPRWVLGEVIDALETVEASGERRQEGGARRVLARLGIGRG